VQLRQARFFVEGGSSRQFHPLVDGDSSRQSRPLVEGGDAGKGTDNGMGTRADERGGESISRSVNGTESIGVSGVVVKYTFNNGVMAADPKLAVGYFLHAIEKIPSLIERCEAESESLSRDLPVLREIVAATWRKENDLCDLKTELSALDRKIQLSLTPVTESNDEQDEARNKTQHARPTSGDGEQNYAQNEAQHEKATAADEQVHQSHNMGPSTVSECLNEYKESMSDRLVVASVPKPDAEHRSKGIRM